MCWLSISDGLRCPLQVAGCICWLSMSGGLQMRVMPNTPCLIGQAASAYVLGTHATDDDAQKTYALMSSVGELTTLPCTVPASLAYDTMSAKTQRKAAFAAQQDPVCWTGASKQWLAH